MSLDEIVNAKGHPMPTKEGIDVFAEPARVAKLQRPTNALRYSFEKGGKSIRVYMPARGKLNQDRPERGAKKPGPFDEVCHGVRRVFEALDVGPVTAELQRITEAFGRCFSPSLEGGRFR